MPRNKLLLLIGLLTLVLGVHTAFAQTTTAIVVNSTTASAIPDNGSVANSITVPDVQVISDVNISVNISHPHGGDLRISLRHDDTGTTVVLLNRLNGPGFTFGCGANSINATFDDSANAPMDSFDCSGNFDANVTGGWQPTGSLASFNGQNTSGTWTLVVEDIVTNDTGTLNSWSVIFNDLQAVASGASGPALAVPNEGMVTIHGGNSQPVYFDPGGDTIKDGNGNNVILPNDADKNGFDTYVVTETQLVGEDLWVGIFLGNASWGWVPLERVQQDTLLPPPSNPTTTASDESGKGPTK